MLLISFVSLLLGLAPLGGFALVANPLMERQPPGAPPEPEPDPHDFLPKRTRRAPAKRLLYLGLLAAIAAGDAIPVLGLKSKKDLKRDLQKYQGASGFVVKTSNIQPPALSRLRTVLEASQCHLLSQDDHFELIVDSGCSKSVSPCLSDFIPGSLVDLPSPLSLDGIAGQLVAHQKGRLQYEILNDAGGVTILECEGYHLPDLKIRLFSPQILLGEQKGGKFVLEWNRSYLALSPTGTSSPSDITNRPPCQLFEAFTMSWLPLKLSPLRASWTRPSPISQSSNNVSSYGTPSGAILAGSTLSGWAGVASLDSLESKWGPRPSTLLNVLPANLGNKNTRPRQVPLS
jgi:hypothetical protein